MNKKENFLLLINGKNAGWIGDPWEAFKGNFFDDIFIDDPISSATGGINVTGIPYKDMWGVSWLQIEGHSATPYITEENKAIKDINRWEDELIVPPLDGYDWSDYIAFAESVDRSKYLTISMVSGGLFERSHYLMGFEDALCNYMITPDIMTDLLKRITEWKIEHIRLIIDNIHPDIIMFHDDWGTKSALFLPPGVWRDVIKPLQKKIVECVRSKGVIYMHHSDTICEPIVEDMADIGIQIWQGAIPQNDIVKIQHVLNGRMAIMGGIDASIIDRPDFDDNTIRSEVRRCIDTYCPQRYFIPCIPNITPVISGVKDIYIDELKKYGADFFIKPGSEFKIKQPGIL